MRRISAALSRQPRWSSGIARQPALERNGAVGHATGPHIMATPFDASSNAGTVTPDMVQTGSDIPAEWKPPRDHRDYV